MVSVLDVLGPVMIALGYKMLDEHPALHQFEYFRHSQIAMAIVRAAVVNVVAMEIQSQLALEKGRMDERIVPSSLELTVGKQ